MKKTTALCCILKNEINNLDRFLESVEGCFDEIHMTDTGSDDGSKELLEKYSKTLDNPAKTKIYLHHFKWVNDFAKARNYSFSHAETDYLMWMDLDDVMSDKKAFQLWRDSIMPIADFWLATYNYAYKDGKAVCSFARERCLKRELKCEWKYFVHEGLIPPAGCAVNYAVTWSINHLRTDEDVKKDRSRNISMFEGNELDDRMIYYYGKELFEAGKVLEGYAQLIRAAKSEKIELHDRIMAIQYACLSAMILTQYNEAIKIAYSGLQLDPQRAEYHVAIADSYLKLNRAQDAIPFYHAAKEFKKNGKIIL